MSQEETKSREAGGDAAARSKSKPNGTDRGATGDELLEALAAQALEHPEPTSSVWRAMRDIVLVTALLSGGVYFYYGHVTTKEAVNKLAVAANDRLEKDDLRSLRNAEEKYLEILKLDDDNPIALSALAETYFHQTRHGLDKLAQAEAYLQKSVVEESQKPERYAADAYIKIYKGKVEQASREIQALLDQGFYNPKLAHAYGWAKLEQGDYLRANQVIQQAVETRYAAVRFALSLAEVAHRQNRDRAALRHLNKALKLNPEHGIAKAWSAALRAKTYGNLGKPVQFLGDLKKKKTMGPVAKAHMAWAEGELALALQNTDGALEKVDAGLKEFKGDFPPLLDLKARAHLAKGQTDDARAAYERGAKAKPPYRGLSWGLARLERDALADRALEIVAQLESGEKGTPGPEYEIFRGDFYLRKGELEKATAAYTKAADLGNDADILLGLAKVAFEEEKGKDNKADLERVAEKFQTAMEARPIYPELNEYMAGINLWNYQVPAADEALLKAESEYKKLKRPVPELVRFFDRVLTIWRNPPKDRKVKKQAKKMVPMWEERKAEYLRSVAQFTN